MEQMEPTKDYSLTINVDNTTMAKASELNNGMQGLVNDLGVDGCLTILNNIKKHPAMFEKALSLMNDPIKMGLIKNFL